MYTHTVLCVDMINIDKFVDSYVYIYIPASSQTILFLVVWARNAFAPLAALFHSESAFDVLRVLAQLSLHLQGSVFAKLQINRVKLPKCHPLPWGVPLTQASQSKSVWLYSIKIFWIDLGSAMIL